MKIAIVSTMDEAPWGGSEELWSGMAERALEDGHKVCTLTSFWPECPTAIDQLKARGAAVAFQRQLARLPSIWQRRQQRLLNLFNQARGVGRYRYFEPLHMWQPDMVCVSMGHIYEFLRHPGLIEFLKSTDVPFVLLGEFVDDVRIPLSARLDLVSRIFDRASKIVFVSQRNRHDVERHLARHLPHAVVVHNPVNLEDRSIVPWPATDHPSLAVVGRLSIVAKGQDLLMEALSSPTWRDRNWTLNLYGEGPDRDYLQSLVSFFEMEDRVHFHGHVEDLRQVWAQNHLLVMPSRGEGTPLALVEAQLCGRPAVVTDVGGNAEWVEEGVTGFLAAGPSAKAIDAALNRAWTQLSQWPTLGTSAHHQATEKSDPQPEETLLSLLVSAQRQTNRP